MTATVTYNGNLRNDATHLRSGTTIQTDAPTDNEGLGQRFSPTDLVATALAACMTTVMGIKAKANGYNLDGTNCEVEKIMGTDPRRIVEIKIKITFPNTAPHELKDRTILENTARNCPVLHSLHPDLTKTISFVWTAAD